MNKRRQRQPGKYYGRSMFVVSNYLYVSSIQFSAFFSFCTVFFGVYLIKRYIPFANVFQILLAGITMVIYLKHSLHDKLRIPKSAMILLIDAGYVLLVSLINGQSFANYLSMLVPILVVCSTLMMVQNRNDMLAVLRVWCACMFTVVMIDLGTMILWPNGMYKTRYPINWFLGYKTHRLDYSFTLLVLYTCYSLLKYKRLKKSMFWLSVLVLVNTYLCRATGATIAVATYAAVLYLLRNQLGQQRSTHSGRLILFLLQRYRLLFCIYLAVTLFLVILNDASLMTQVALLFNKSVTFSGRVKIWVGAADMIKNNLLFGNGVLSASQYSEALGFNNPHNMLYSYIITGGIVGTAILFLAIGNIFSILRKNPGWYYIGLYMYCVFLLGLVSSTMSFSPFFFAIMLLVPVLTRVEKKDVSDESQ